MKTKAQVQKTGRYLQAGTWQLMKKLLQAVKKLKRMAV